MNERVTRPLARPSAADTEHRMRPNNHTNPPATVTTDEHTGAIWFAKECRRNGVRLESCISRAQLAGDSELVDFFRRARRLLDGTAS
jgi:hypothetical protein